MAQIFTQLNKSYEVLGYTFDTSMILWIIGVIVSAWLLNKASNVFIRGGIIKRGGDPHVAATVEKFTDYILYFLALIAILGVLGVPFTALGTVVGLLGFGISFALKDMIANFISGTLILISHPFKIGDQIRVDGEEGTVQDIKIRATSIRTYDGREVIVPNSKLYSGTVVNNTSYDQRRFELVVGISYDDDIDKSKELAMEALEEAENVDPDPEPQVLVNELGGSSVNLKLRGWTKPSRANLVESSSEVTQIVKEKFDAEDINIPYPIRTVYMSGQED